MPKTVPEMWTAWCSRCHGKDGTGKVAEPTVTVKPMDFTKCSLSTAEGDPDWEAVISKGFNRMFTVPQLAANYD